VTATPIHKRVFAALLVVALLVLGSALPASAQPSPDLVKFQIGDATLGMPTRWAETLFRARTEGHWRDAKSGSLKTLIDAQAPTGIARFNFVGRGITSRLPPEFPTPFDFGILIDGMRQSPGPAEVAEHLKRDPYAMPPENAEVDEDGFVVRKPMNYFYWVRPTHPRPFDQLLIVRYGNRPFPPPTLAYFQISSECLPSLATQSENPL
jgi:hypothetical protein